MAQHVQLTRGPLRSGIQAKAHGLGILMDTIMVVGIAGILGLFIVLGMLNEMKESATSQEPTATSDDSELEVMNWDEHFAGIRQEWLEACDYDPRLIHYHEILDELRQLINTGGSQERMDALWIELAEEERRKP